MKCRALFVVACIYISEVICAKTPGLSAPNPTGRAKYLNSYMPAAMQVLAHLTNQMKFERPKPVATTTTTTTTEKPPPPPLVPSQEASTQSSDVISPSPIEHTTQFHAPGVFAPIVAPLPERILPFRTEESLPPIMEYTHDEPVLIPYETNIPLLLYANVRNPAYVPQNYQPDPSGYWPLIARSEPVPDISSLPVQNENNFKANPLEIEPEELSEENLQYLSPDIRDMLRRQRDYKDEVYTRHSSIQSIENLYDETGDGKFVGDWLRLKKSPPSQTFIQMLLLYDLLSRDAKKQKLNSYHGYADDLLKDLVETSHGTAIDQLKVILERMVARGDCSHDFANNRAKEMVAELEKPDSNTSNEIRYLEPLRFAE